MIVTILHNNDNVRSSVHETYFSRDQLKTPVEETTKRGYKMFHKFPSTRSPLGHKETHIT